MCIIYFLAECVAYIYSIRYGEDTQEVLMRKLMRTERPTSEEMWFFPLGGAICINEDKAQFFHKPPACTLKKGLAAFVL